MSIYQDPVMLKYDLECPTTQEELEFKQTIKTIKDSIIDNKWTLSQASENLCIAKTTLHRYIHSYIKVYYYEDYEVICSILKFNKEYKFKPKSKWHAKLVWF